MYIFDYQLISFNEDLVNFKVNSNAVLTLGCECERVLSASLFNSTYNSFAFTMQTFVD